METFGNKIQQNSATTFYCKCCDVTCSSKYNYKTHLLSRKHHKETLGDKNGNKIQQNSANSAKIAIYVCECCQKKYKSRGGLWKHKTTCSISTVEKMTTNCEISNSLDEMPNGMDKNNIILKLLDQNASLQNQIIEMSKEKSTVIHNNNITNNNQFNLNVFLNEQCKDAINFMDFVNSLQLQIKDLEITGKLGYAEGISKIFINGLKELELHKRPIHCSDLKREIFYIKDSNIWEKENKENEKMKKAIQVISNKNIKQISQWQKENPECFDIENKKNDEYMQIVYSAMCDKDEEDKNYEKIIKNVAKEVIINKN